MNYSVDNSKAIAPVTVALAILYRENKFLMQLRDNIPNIAAPGVWGLFGGHLEPGESAAVGLKRELVEEINYVVDRPIEFRCYPDSKAIRHVFYAPLHVDVDDLELNEGWDLALVDRENIHRGRCYSEQAKEERPLGIIHRQILLDFLTCKTSS